MKLSDILGGQPEPEITLNGSFGCQNDSCTEDAEEASYNEASKSLKWKCPNGHLSSIDEFSM